MNTRRTTGHVRNFAPALYAPLETLEPRQLLATWFNPDGPTVATPAQSPTSMVTADFDGDNKADLVTAVGKDIFFQKGGGGGRFGAPQRIARFNTDAGLLGVGDFDGDNRPDIFSIQKGVHQGWHRLLLNTGLGRFTTAAYGRAWTAVESVTVGNIDSDPMAEVLLKGAGPLVALNSIWGEAPDEIRILDPLVTITAQPANIIPGPYVRFIDLGPALYGQKLAAPLIANLRGTSTPLIIVGGQDADTATGFVQAYSFTQPAPIVGTGAQTLGLPGPLFNPEGDRIIVAGVVTSIAAADISGDSKTDLIVSTLTQPDLTDVPPPPLGDYTARTLILPRTGSTTDLTFGAPEEVETRSLPAGDLIQRAQAPEYTIASVADLNSDGRLDVGLSIIEDFRIGLSSYTRTGAFVQALRNDTGSAFTTSIVAQVTSQYSPFTASLARTQLFLAADIRRVGRPDLFVVDQPSPTDAVRISVRFNVRTLPIIPFEG